MFKKGDIVVRKKYGHGKFDEGDIAKISEVDSQSSIILEGDDFGYTHVGGSLRLATPEEKDKYEKDNFPKYWCIKQNTDQIVCDWFEEHNDTSSARLEGNFIYLCFDSETNRATFQYNNDHFTEITLEQFKKHILKMDNKLIGYKLKSDYAKYKTAALTITSTNSWEYKLQYGIIITYDSISAKLLREAGVLDLWFEPVYKEEDIIIGNTYKVEFDSKGYAKINGTNYSKYELEKASQVLELPGVKGLEVGCSGQYRIDLATIKKILSRL